MIEAYRYSHMDGYPDIVVYMIDENGDPNDINNYEFAVDDEAVRTWCENRAMKIVKEILQGKREIP